MNQQLIERGYRAKEKIERTIRRMERMAERLDVCLLVAQGATVVEMTQAQAEQRLTVIVDGIEKAPEP